MLRTCTLLILLALPVFAQKAEPIVFESFEGDGFGEWKLEGTAFGQAPSHDGPGKLAGQLTGYSGAALACSFHGGDAAIGTLLSPPFTIEHKYLSFLIAGGNHPGETAAELLIDGEVVKTASGRNSNDLRQETWDLKNLQGKKARIRLLDSHQGAWGLLIVDHLVFSDGPKPKIPRNQKGGKATGALLASPDIDGLLVPPGVTAKVFADHKTHQITSPTAICFDEQGRLLVAETHRFRFGVEDNRDHLYWLHDDLASQTVGDRRALHEKWDHKVSMKSLSEVTEVVRLLTDTDQDGQADQSQVYAENFKEVIDGPAAGIFHHEGTTYLACIPHIWALRDPNGDGVAEERTSLQDGMGVRVSFSGHDLNGFALGPDGRLYGTIGDRGLNVTTKEGRHFVYPNQGSVFRFEPDGSNFEVVHTGLRNPKEIAFDKWGNGISVDNNSDQGDKARVVYLMEGADSGWRMGHQVLHSFHSTVGIPQHPQNQWMAEKMWAPRHKGQPAWILPPIANLTSGPSGLTYHPGTGYSTGCKDRFLICDYRGAAASSGLWSFSVAPKGADMQLVASEKFNWGTAATDVEFGYDGRLYVSDFMGGWASHQDGRIYVLDSEEGHDLLAGNVQTLMRAGFQNRSTKELAGLMDHPDLRIRTRAHVALAAKEGALDTLLSVLTHSESPLHRLHATWGLWIVARTTQQPEATAALLPLLRDQDPEIRAQAARALGEAALPDPSSLRSALQDESLRVRSFAALSLARQRDQGAWENIITLLAQNKDQDAALRHAGTMALIACGNAKKISELKSDSRPALRLAAVLALRRLEHSGLIPFLHDPEPHIADEALRAIHDLPLEEGRPNLVRLLDDYAPGGSGRPLSRIQLRRLLHSAFRFGTPESARRLLVVAQNDTLDIGERTEALRLIDQWTSPPAVDQSTGRYLPLAERPPEDILEILTSEFPKFLTQDDRLLAPTLSLIRQYNLPHDCIPNSSLEELLSNDSRSNAVHEAALRLLVHRQPGNLLALLRKVATQSKGAVSVQALEQLVELDPDGNLPALTETLYHGPLVTRRKAWSIIGQLEGSKAAKTIVDGLTRLQNGKIPPKLQLEVLEAAESRKEPEVVSALAGYWESRPKDDPLAAWTSTFEGGDPSQGKQVYQSHPAAQCARCHRATPGHSEGGDAGPNLSGIGKSRSARQFVNSLIHPSADIVAGFGIATITFTNGETLTGNLMGETDAHLDLAVAPDLWRISKKDIAKRSAPVSAMPPMANLLSKREIRDLTAWLSSLTKEPETTDPPQTPKPFKPATALPSNQAPAPAPSKSTDTPKPEPEPQPKPEPPPEPEADSAPPAPTKSTPERSHENPTSIKSVFWTLIVLAWIGICLLPVLFGLKNR